MFLIADDAIYPDLLPCLSRRHFLDEVMIQTVAFYQAFSPGKSDRFEGLDFVPLLTALADSPFCFTKHCHTKGKHSLLGRPCTSSNTSYIDIHGGHSNSSKGVPPFQRPPICPGSCATSPWTFKTYYFSASFEAP
jgi:hypothetical protein